MINENQFILIGRKKKRICVQSICWNEIFFCSDTIILLFLGGGEITILILFS